MAGDRFLDRIKRLVTHARSGKADRAGVGVRRVSDNGQVTVDAVARVYAGALFELAQARGNLDEVAAEMRQIDGLLVANPDMHRLLQTPAISKSDRAQVLGRVFKGRVSEVVYNFLQVLNGKGRLPSLRGIVAALDDRIDEHNNVVEVQAWTAAEMSTSEADAVAGQIGQGLGKKVVLRRSVDPDLIGGLKLRIGDKLIDGSVAAQLRAMRRQLSEVGLEKARA